MPFISIVIPVYNVEQYIKRALESCINQTLNDIEIIVVAIAYDFAKLDSRIRIIHNERNLGLFYTRIQGERIVNGDYILHLDSDDYIDNRTCKILYKSIFNPKDHPLQDIELIKAIGGGGYELS